MLLATVQYSAAVWCCKLVLPGTEIAVYSTHNKEKWPDLLQTGPLKCAFKWSMNTFFLTAS